MHWSLTFQQKSYACKQIDKIPLILETDWISYMPKRLCIWFYHRIDKEFSLVLGSYHIPATEDEMEKNIRFIIKSKLGINNTKLNLNTKR